MGSNLTANSVAVFWWNSSIKYVRRKASIHRNFEWVAVAVVSQSQAADSASIGPQFHLLTPGRYVGAAEIEDDGIPFEEKMAELSATLYEQFAEVDRLEATVKENLEVLGYGE